MDLMDYFFVVLAFLSVALLSEGLLALWRAHHGPVARRIAQRLQEAAGPAAGVPATLAKQRTMSHVPAMDRWMKGIPILSQLDRMLRQAGSPLIVGQFLAVMSGAAIAGALAGALVRLPMGLCLVLAVPAALAPVLWITHVRSRRLLAIDHQLPGIMDLMSRAMRAGHSFSSALQMAATEGAAPAAREFQIAFEEISFGISIPDAMVHLAERVPSNDLRFLVVAVITQRETGGNLAELLSNTAALIRSRHKLLGQVRVLATEGKLSAWILVLLPFALAAMLQLVNPDFMRSLWNDPAGMRVVAAALVAMVVGVFWMWRAVKIHV